MNDPRAINGAHILESITFKVYSGIEIVETSIDPFGVHQQLPVYPVKPGKTINLFLIVILLHQTTVH